MTVVFINEPAPPEHSIPIDVRELASRGIEPLDTHVVVLSPDTWPAAEVDATSQDERDPAMPEAAGDKTQHALLYGRYVSQVQARIERAWMRPRSEIGAAQFSCQARISQDRAGNVVGIKLEHCNGTPRWQQSLVSAIRTASPLPAPPDPSVYADRLWLNFESGGFTASVAPEGFEPPTRDSLVADDRYNEVKRFEHFAGKVGSDIAASHDRDDTNVIHLTIVGSPSDGTRPQVGALSVSAPEPTPESSEVLSHSEQ